MSDSIGIDSVQMPTPKMPMLKAKSPEQLEKAAKEFEGMFMDIVMKSMRDTVQESSEFGDPEKVKFFQSMLDTEYAAQMGKEGKIGLSAAIVRQLGPKVSPTNAKVTEKI